MAATKKRPAAGMKRSSSTKKPTPAIPRVTRQDSAAKKLRSNIIKKGNVARKARNAAYDQKQAKLRANSQAAAKKNPPKPKAASPKAAPGKSKPANIRYFLKKQGIHVDIQRAGHTQHRNAVHSVIRGMANYKKKGVTTAAALSNLGKRSGVRIQHPQSSVHRTVKWSNPKQGTSGASHSTRAAKPHTTTSASAAPKSAGAAPKKFMGGSGGGTPHNYTPRSGTAPIMATIAPKPIPLPRGKPVMYGHAYAKGTGTATGIRATGTTVRAGRAAAPRRPRYVASFLGRLFGRR